MKRFLSFTILALALASTSPAFAASPPLSLHEGRFLVQAEWRTPDGQTGSGTAVALTRDTGYFWFFSSTNVEVVVKVLDGCAVNSRFWVFASGLTDAEVKLTVIDDETGDVQIYRNAQGTPFAPVQDTDAFFTCGIAHCRANQADIAASPRARPDLEAMAIAMAGTVAAPQAVYDRVVRDLGTIRFINHPWFEVIDLEGMPFQPNYDPYTLVLDLDEEAAVALVANDYDDWWVLNRCYRIRSASYGPTGRQARLYSSAVLDMRKLVNDYEALPGIVSARPADPEPLPVDPLLRHITSYCGQIEGSVYKYYARFADGHIYHFFTTVPGASPIVVGWGKPDYGFPWLAGAQACFREHVDPLS